MYVCQEELIAVQVPTHFSARVCQESTCKAVQLTRVILLQTRLPRERAVLVHGVPQGVHDACAPQGSHARRALAAAGRRVRAHLQLQVRAHVADSAIYISARG